MQSTVKISAMVFVILLGASVFSLVFRGLGGDEIVEAVLAEMPGGAFGAMFVVMALMFFMGFFLDFIEIIFVVRSEEHTSELQSLMRISYAVFCLKTQKNNEHQSR